MIGSTNEIRDCLLGVESLRVDLRVAMYFDPLRVLMRGWSRICLVGIGAVRGGVWIGGDIASVHLVVAVGVCYCGRRGYQSGGATGVSLHPDV